LNPALFFLKTRTGQAVGLILLATLSFAALDTATKFATQAVPVLMLLWFRYAFQAVVTAALRWPVQGRAFLRTPNPRFQALRGLLLLSVSTCSFYGLQHLPVGEFTAIVMLSPMAATAMAGIFLGQSVLPVRWVLMAVGLGGVWMVVRPGGQVFGWALLFPVVLVVTYGWFQVLTSRLSGDENPYTTHFYTGLVGALLLAPVQLGVWDATAWSGHWPWFLVVGFLGTFGHWMLIHAFNRASAGVLSPFLYTQIAFATLLGWLVFAHVPDALAWAGIAVIAASGVGNALVSLLEHRRRRQ